MALNNASIPTAAKKSTRDNIIKIAARLFWERSYESVGVDMICKEAGVHKGSFYHFFPSKETLAIAVLDTMWCQLEDALLKPCFAANIPPLQRFEQFVNRMDQNICSIFDKKGKLYGCPFGNMAVELASQSEVVRVKVEELFVQYMRYFEQSLEDARQLGDIPKDRDPKKLAGVIFSCLQGIALMTKTTNKPEVLREYLQAILKLLK